MQKIIYQSTVSNIGEFAKDTLSEGMLITFKEGAPADLSDYCFTHTHDELLADLAVGQIIKLGQQEYLITAVGAVATTNFRELGHLTLRFDGGDSAELPGSIHVDGAIPETLAIGDEIVVKGNK
ncbi:PTS glucitol/sorbitol transporter subunit IIA [Orbus mooreae]|uniref:PTS glucitol/sorbitol transporter subunit IIA n=1 Tax=Orbus mooreae TaxID=3074107 RepID=UPI00370D4E95